MLFASRPKIAIIAIKQDFFSTGSGIFRKVDKSIVLRIICAEKNKDSDFVHNVLPMCELMLNFK